MTAALPFAKSSIETITFDCYGTLIDWEGGMRAAFAEIPSLAGADVGALIRTRDEAERRLEAGPFQPYAAVLARSLQEAAGLLGVRVREEEARAFAASIRRWPAFPDTADALARLAARFRLGVLSNVDRADLEATLAPFGVRIELLVPAEEVRTYKPHPGHWEAALRETGASPEAFLHASVSPFHDLYTAASQGWRTAWVLRGAGRGAGGVTTDLVVEDLSALADALGV